MDSYIKALLNNLTQPQLQTILAPKPVLSNEANCLCNPPAPIAFIHFTEDGVAKVQVPLNNLLPTYAQGIGSIGALLKTFNESGTFFQTYSGRPFVVITSLASGDILASFISSTNPTPVLISTALASATYSLNNLREASSPVLLSNEYGYGTFLASLSLEASNNVVLSTSLQEGTYSSGVILTGSETIAQAYLEQGSYLSILTAFGVESYLTTNLESSLLTNPTSLDATPIIKSANDFGLGVGSLGSSSNVIAFSDLDTANFIASFEGSSVNEVLLESQFGTGSISTGALGLGVDFINQLSLLSGSFEASIASNGLSVLLITTLETGSSVSSFNAFSSPTVINSSLASGLVEAVISVNGNAPLIVTALESALIQAVINTTGLTPIINTQLGSSNSFASFSASESSQVLIKTYLNNATSSAQFNGNATNSTVINSTLSSGSYITTSGGNRNTLDFTAGDNSQYLPLMLA